MSSDTESIDSDTSDEISETIWDKIVFHTFNANKEKLIGYSDWKKLRHKFKNMFLENVKYWIPMINDFMESDELKAAIWDTKDSNPDMDEDEAILFAIEKRKYKLFKIIDWDYIRDLVHEEMDEDEEEEEVVEE